MEQHIACGVGCVGDETVVKTENLFGEGHRSWLLVGDSVGSVQVQYCGAYCVDASDAFLTVPELPEINILTKRHFLMPCLNGPLNCSNQSFCLKAGVGSTLYSSLSTLLSSPKLPSSFLLPRNLVLSPPSLVLFYFAAINQKEMATQDMNPVVARNRTSIPRVGGLEC